MTNNQRADATRGISCPCSSLPLLLTGACFFSSFIPPSFESWPEAVGLQLVAYRVAEGMQGSLAFQPSAREDRDSGQWIPPGFHASLHILIDVTWMTNTPGTKNAILGRA